MVSANTGEHVHGRGCGHSAIEHGDHIDYLVNGRLDHKARDESGEHRLEVTDENPDQCSPLACSDTRDHASHEERVPHGDHFDYLVEGRLHHVHGDHCDDHGPILLG
jgi:hypothetical protein